MGEGIGGEGRRKEGGGGERAFSPMGEDKSRPGLVLIEGKRGGEDGGIK